MPGCLGGGVGWALVLGFCCLSTDKHLLSTCGLLGSTTGLGRARWVSVVCAERRPMKPFGWLSREIL